MTRKRTVYYATKSAFKREEINFILEDCVLRDHVGQPVKAADVFDINFVDVSTNEPLERDLSEMVRHKAKSAFGRLLWPCIVEHAGLILDDWSPQNFPGGLTQPMWDALGAENFVKSLEWAGRDVVARAVVGYCDGASVSIFTGETKGKLSSQPRGNREFYWDTIFCPDGGDDLTYAEISEQKGIEAKMALSQSSKALKAFLQSTFLSVADLFPEP